MRALLLAIALIGCASAPAQRSTCLDEAALARYVSVQQAVSAPNYLALLMPLARGDGPATSAAVAHALGVDSRLAAEGDPSAAIRVQHERAWLADHPAR